MNLKEMREKIEKDIKDLQDSFPKEEVYIPHVADIRSYDINKEGKPTGQKAIEYIQMSNKPHKVKKVLPFQRERLIALESSLQATNECIKAFQEIIQKEKFCSRTLEDRHNIEVCGEECHACMVVDLLSQLPEVNNG